MPGVLVAEQRAVRPLVACSRSRKETIFAVGLDQIGDTVGARIGLDQPCARVFVHPSVLSVVASKPVREHVDRSTMSSSRFLIVATDPMKIVRSLVGGGVETGTEQPFVVADRRIEEIF